MEVRAEAAAEAWGAAAGAASTFLAMVTTPSNASDRSSTYQHGPVRHVRHTHTQTNEHISMPRGFPTTFSSHAPLQHLTLPIYLIEAHAAARGARLAQLNRSDAPNAIGTPLCTQSRGTGRGWALQSCCLWLCAHPTADTMRICSGECTCAIQVTSRAGEKREGERDHTGQTNQNTSIANQRTAPATASDLS